MKDNGIDDRDDQALEAYWQFQGTPGIWEPSYRGSIVSNYKGFSVEVAEYVVNNKDRDLILQAKPLLEWAIKHREHLRVLNLESGSINWYPQIDELTELIHKALGYKEDGKI